MSYSGILNFCPSVLRLCSSTSQHTGLVFTFHSSHGGLTWVCWRPEAARWFCQLTKPVCPGLALCVLAAVTDHHFSLAATVRNGWLQEEELGAMWAEDVLRSQRVSLVQAGKTDWTSQLSPRAQKTNSSTAAVIAAPLQKDPGSCPDTVTAKDRTEMSFHLLQRLEMDGWP